MHPPGEYPRGRSFVAGSQCRFDDRTRDLIRSYPPRLEVVKRHLVDTIEELEGVEIDPVKSMKDLGANSLDIVEVVSCSMRELKVKVPRTELNKLTNQILIIAGVSLLISIGLGLWRDTPFDVLFLTAIAFSVSASVCRSGMT